MEAQFNGPMLCVRAEHHPSRGPRPFQSDSLPTLARAVARWVHNNSSRTEAACHAPVPLRVMKHSRLRRSAISS